MEIDPYLPDPVRETYLRKFAVGILATAIVVAGIGLITQSAVSSELSDQRHEQLQTSAQ